MSRPPRHRRPLIEALEPRLLFSATADIAVFDDGNSDGQYLANAANQVDLVSLYMPSEPLIMESQASDFDPLTDLPLDESPAITTVVFVDTAVDNYATLVEDIRARVDNDSVAIVYLDTAKDGIAQMSDYLAGASGISAVHVISHGVAGSLQLGNAVLNENNIAQYAEQIAIWKTALGEDADILLYGCDLAANQGGLNFLRQLSDLTGADVAASNDLTGNSRADADWVLEENVGIIETQSLFAANEPMEWQGTLADVVYVNLAAANNQATVSSTNNVGQTIQYQGGAYTVDQISIQLLKDPTAALQTITVELRNDWHGAVLATASISSAALTDTFQWVNFDFGETNLTVDTVYWIRISSTGTDGLIKTAYSIGNTYNNGVYMENGNGDGGRELALRVANSDGINAAPTVTNAIPNQTVTEGSNLNYSFPSNTFNDPDGDNLSYTAKLANGDPLPAWLTFNQATRTFTGVADDGNVGTISIRVTATDGNGEAVFDDFDLTVNDLPEAPFVVNPIPDQVASGFTQFTYQFAAYNEASPVFADPDVGGSVVSYRATLADGSPLPGWLNFDSATRTFSGIPTNADAGTLSIRLYGTDNTGLESVTPDQFNIVISASANDAPVNTVPGAQATNEDTPLVFSSGSGNQIQIADADALSGNVRVTLGVSNGVLTLGGTAGLSFTTGDGTNDATLVFTGTVANINAALATLTYTPTSNYSGADTLSIVTNDLGNSGTGGALSDSDTVAIAVNAVNDAPVNTVPGAQTATEDTALVFSSGNGNQIQVNDVDVGGGTMEVTLSVTNGTLTLAGTAGLGFTTGDGTADSTMVFTGTRVDINAALATLTFNPTANYNGAAVLSLTTSDQGNTGAGGTLTDADNVNITINPANDAPTVANVIPDQNATEDTPFSFQFAGNTFSDIDVGNTLTYSAQLNGGGGLPAWLSFDSATRTFSGTPLNADVGTITIDVTANDGNGGTVTDTFTITVLNTNDAPTVAIPIPNQNATEDAAFNFQFAAGAFTDQDVGNTLTYTALLAGGGALPAWLSFDDTTRTFSGTPANGDVGTISVRVTANDGAGGTVSDVFDITVANTNDAPVVANQIANQTATENALFNFSFAANTFNDPDLGDTLSYSAQLAGGSPLPGWLSFDSATRTFSGTPANGDVGNITIEVIASDGSLTVSDFFDIAIGNSDDSPVLVNPIPNQNATEDLAYTFQFSDTTFNDPDIGDTLTYTATLSDDSALPGWLSFDPLTRTFSGTPTNGDVGTITIKVTAADNDGGPVATDTFDLVVANTNDAPTVLNPISNQNATEDTIFNFTFAADTFTDQDVGNTLTYTALLNGGGALPAWLSFDAATRTFSGTPLNADVGTISIDVTANDGNGGTVTDTFDISIANTNDAPTVANAIPNQNATQGAAFNFQFDANVFADQDTGNTLSYTAQLAGGGSLPAWLSFDAATRTFSGTPANGDVGTVAIDVIANDGNGGTVTDTFDIVVANVNDAPTVTIVPTDYNAQEQVFMNLHGTGISVADADGDALTITLTGAGSNSNLAATVGTTGVVIVSGVNTNTLILSGTAAQLNDLFAGNNGSTLTYRLSGNTPVASVLLTVSASDGSLSGSDTATIHIEAINDGPTNDVPGAQVTDEDTALVFSGANGNRIQVDDLDVVAGNLEVTLSVTNGTLTLAGTAGLTFTTGDGTADSSLVFRGTQDDINDALNGLIFNPTANYTGAAVLTITTSDLGNTGTGGTLVDSDNIDITIGAVNDAPTVATPIPNQNATEDAGFNFQFAAGAFADADLDALSYSATLAGGGALPAWLSFNPATRTFSGTPANADVGTLSIDVTASDGNGGTVTDTFDIVIANSNDAPTVAAPIADQIANEGAAFNFQFGAGAFADVDVGDTLSYSAQLNGGGALPAWLSFDAATRTFSGTPANGDVGTISIDVTAADGNGGTVTDTFDIVITNTNEAPTVANAISDQNATQSIAFNFQFAANTFADADVGNTLTYSAQLNGGGALPAWLSFNAATRTFSGTPADGDVGTITIDVTANDGNGGTVTDTFTLTVADANDAPTVANPIPNQNATEDAAFNFQFAANTFNDGDAGDTLSYSARLNGGGALPAWLSFDAATRTFSGTPTDGDVGTITIDVTANDGNGGTVIDTFTLTVADTNDAPIVAFPIADQGATENTAFNFTFGANVFADPDAGDTLTYSAQLAGGAPLPDWLNFNPATRNFSGTPANADAGTITIEVTANDGNGGTVTDSFVLTITSLPVNAPPFVQSPIADQVAAESQPFGFSFPATTFVDPEGDSLSYSAQLAGGAPLPAWLSFDAATRSFSGTPAAGDIGSITILVTASDGNGGSISDSFVIVVNNTNDVPVLVNPPADQTALEDSPFSVTFPAAMFSDADAGTTLVYSAQLSGGAPLPDWLVFDATTLTFSGTPAQEDVGNLSIQIIASDGIATATTEFDLAVLAVNDAPATTGDIVINNVEDAPGDQVDLWALFSDQETAARDLVFSLVSNSNPSLVSNASIDLASGKLQLNYGANQFGSSDLVVRAQDEQGAWVDTLVRVNIAPVNDVPVSSGIADINVKAGAAPQQMNLHNVFSDVENGTALSWELMQNSNNSIVTSAQIDPTTGLMTLAFSAQNGGESTIVLRAQDSEGAWVETQFKVTVAALEKPPVTPPVTVPPVTTPPVEQPTTPPTLPPTNPPTTPPTDGAKPPIDGGSTGTDESEVPGGLPGPGGNGGLENLLPDAPYAQQILVDTNESSRADSAINDKSSRDIERAEEALNDNNVPLATLTASPSLASLIAPDAGFAPWEEAEFDNEVRRLRAQMDEAMVEEQDRKAVVAGLTFSVTTGLLVWSLRASSLLLTMMSMLPLWRGLDPLPILDEVNKRKKELEQQRKDREREDKNAKEVGYLFDHAQRKESGS